MRRVVVPNNALFEDVKLLVEGGKMVTILTKGNSMLPFIIGGRDSVQLSGSIQNIKRGDIILAFIPLLGTYVLHRIVCVDANNITLKGDGNLIGVETCAREDVVAVVTSIIKPRRLVDPQSNRARKLANLWSKNFIFKRYILAIMRRLM